ncbi:MAG: DUF4253 domain-containing protein [Clostridiales Family XIII bacterium]|jgi:hypothetical protein|nr:DUF4253 domain-containing protein [Clostridiales Family XIII bacterium]
MTEDCKYITDYLGCGYELFEEETDGKRIAARWRELSGQGAQEGFFPLIIPVSDTLSEQLYFALEDAGLPDEPSPENAKIVRDGILAKAREADPAAILKPLVEEDYGQFVSPGPGDPGGEFHGYMFGRRPYPEILIAKIPASAPWELPAWVPMGGFNDCPQAADQVAAFRYWHEGYGAVPACVTYEIWELNVPYPPRTEEAAMALAVEQFAFCQDIVWQGMETVGALAGFLKGATSWYFWWD